MVVRPQLPIAPSVCVGRFVRVARVLEGIENLSAQVPDKSKVEGPPFFASKATNQAQ